MKKSVFNSSVSVHFNPEHKGAPYTVDGVHWFNNGNRMEAVVNEWAGYGFGFDTDHVPFDMGSDIEELSASVKSSGASLACLYGSDKAEIIREYFARVHSTMWIYVVEVDSEFWLYQMNAEEFRAMLEEFSGLTRESGKEIRYKLRLKKTSSKMVKWLEERVEE